jgi:hypothetical protein
VAPRTETEQRIAHVWQNVLGLEQVGVYDSFFELGGNSLAGVQAIAQINDDKYFHLADRLINLDYGQVVQDVQVDQSRSSAKTSVAAAQFQPV